MSQKEEGWWASLPWQHKVAWCISIAMIPFIIYGFILVDGIEEVVTEDNIGSFRVFGPLVITSPFDNITFTITHADGWIEETIDILPGEKVVESESWWASGSTVRFCVRGVWATYTTLPYYSTTRDFHPIDIIEDCTTETLGNAFAWSSSDD